MEKQLGMVPDMLLPTYMAKSLEAMKAPRAVKCITFECSEASPGKTLYVSVPKLNENEVLVPDMLALRFDLDLSVGHANNYVVKNVTWALVDKMVVKFSESTLQDTVGYDIYKTFEDLFLSVEEHDNMLLEGIQSVDLSKICSNAGDKPTSSVDDEKQLNDIFGNKYRIKLDHEILTDHSVFYPQALYNNLGFEVMLAPASQVVVNDVDKSKLKYKLTNILLEYEMIRSN